jgi:hypothetical protein
VFYTGAAGRLPDRSLSPEGRAPAPPPPSPVSSSPVPGGLVPTPAAMPSWAWIGCAALFVLVILLVIVALVAGVFIGHGGLGVM